MYPPTSSPDNPHGQLLHRRPSPSTNLQLRVPSISALNMNDRYDDSGMDPSRPHSKYTPSQQPPMSLESLPRSRQSATMNSQITRNFDRMESGESLGVGRMSSTSRPLPRPTNTSSSSSSSGFHTNGVSSFTFDSSPSSSSNPASMPGRRIDELQALRELVICEDNRANRNVQKVERSGTTASPQVSGSFFHATPVTVRYLGDAPTNPHELETQGTLHQLIHQETPTSQAPNEASIPMNMTMGELRQRRFGFDTKNQHDEDKSMASSSGMGIFDTSPPLPYHQDVSYMNPKTASLEDVGLSSQSLSQSLSQSQPQPKSQQPSKPRFRCGGQWGEGELGLLVPEFLRLELDSDGSTICVSPNPETLRLSPTYPKTGDSTATEISQDDIAGSLQMLSPQQQRQLHIRHSRLLALRNRPGARHTSNMLGSSASLSPASQISDVSGDVQRTSHSRAHFDDDESVEGHLAHQRMAFPRFEAPQHSMDLAYASNLGLGRKRMGQDLPIHTFQESLTTPTHRGTRVRLSSNRRDDDENIISDHINDVIELDDL